MLNTGLFLFCSVKLASTVDADKLEGWKKHWVRGPVAPTVELSLFCHASLGRVPNACRVRGRRRFRFPQLVGLLACGMSCTEYSSHTCQWSPQLRARFPGRVGPAVRKRYPFTFAANLFVSGVLAVASWGCLGDSGEGGDALRSEESRSATVSFEAGDREVRVFVRGEPFTTLHFGERWDKPFLYPLRTASGVTVSRGYPIEPREGEESDHAWHRGIWYGHGDISGHDFWRELGRDKTGIMVPLSDPLTEGGAERGTVEMRFGLQAVGGELIGSVVQRYTIWQSGDSNHIDAVLTLDADRGQELRIGDTEDGGFAMRLADDFRQERGAVLRNSAGSLGTENIWGAAARWVDYSAKVGGKPVGVAILDHPSNLRHPSRWHARGYSLSSANPFGLRDFTGDEGADGSYVVPPGSALTLRYRFIIHEGGVPPSMIERWFREFALEALP